jgi:predicted Zn-dependent protease
MNTALEQQPVTADALGSDELRLIGEIGFMACRSRNGKAATAIFTGLRELRPRHAFVFIGLAMARLCIGQPEEAVRILRDEALVLQPDDPELQVFLAIALKEALRVGESRRVLQGLVQGPEEAPAVKRLAATLLAEQEGGLPTAA